MSDFTPVFYWEHGAVGWLSDGRLCVTGPAAEAARFIYRRYGIRETEEIPGGIACEWSPDPDETLRQRIDDDISLRYAHPTLVRLLISDPDDTLASTDPT